MECPICYESFGHAPGCPVGAENETDEQEFDQKRKEALRALKRANTASTRLVAGSGKKGKSNPKHKTAKSGNQRPATSG